MKDFEGVSPRTQLSLTSTNDDRTNIPCVSLCDFVDSCLSFVENACDFSQHFFSERRNDVKCVRSKKKKKYFENLKLAKQSKCVRQRNISDFYTSFRFMIIDELLL